MSESSARMKDVPRNLKPYYVALLKQGERWNQTEGEEDLTPRHLAYLRAQAEAGHYRAAGPVLDGDSLTGLLLIQAENLDEARRIAGEDPAVQAGRLAVEVYAAYLPSLDAVQTVY